MKKLLLIPVMFVGSVLAQSTGKITENMPWRVQFTHDVPPGATYQVYTNGALFVNAMSQASTNVGAFSVSAATNGLSLVTVYMPKLARGAYVVSAVALLGGMGSEPSEPLNLTVEAAKPRAPGQVTAVQ